MSLPPRAKSPAKLVSRYPDFEKVQSERAPFDEYSFTHTQTVDPAWRPGSGANDPSWRDHETVHIDPYAGDRTPLDNYKLLVSGIVPRPIGVVSTEGPDGQRNLAPFSYLQIVNHDPPIFTLGFTMGASALKDTSRHVLSTRECVINLVSEHFVEAANYTSIDAPSGVSEWTLSGLTPAPSCKVKPPRVAEAVFAVEAKLVASHDWFSPSTGEKTGVLAILSGVYFHVREDALNEDRNVVDFRVLRPVGRLGGITYLRAREGFEVLRPTFGKDGEKEKNGVEQNGAEKNGVEKNGVEQNGAEKE